MARFREGREEERRGGDGRGSWVGTTVLLSPTECRGMSAPEATSNSL